VKILIVDNYGESALDWALRCIDAGHRVKWHIAPNPRSQYIGRGLVERVNDWREHMRWADLVFLPDNTKYLRELDLWRERGARIVGPNVTGAMWELDRDEGMRVLERAGIETPTSHEFSDYDKAIAFVKREGRRFVSKPSGVEGDKSLSYCSKDAADLVYMLERWKARGKLKGKFILQEFVPGIEFAVGGWFGPGGFIEGWEENWEHKPLMDHDIGPNTGEQGTVQRFVQRSKLADMLLKPIEAELDRIGYLGCVDVSAIIDEKGKPWPLEFTMRPGWPAFNIQQALQKGDPAEWMVDLLEGRDPKCFDLDRIAIGVVMSLPDYPYDRRPIDEVVGVPLYGLTGSNVANVHPCMMMAAEAPGLVKGKVVTRRCLASAGTYVLVATGTGDTVKAAKDSAYRVVKSLRMPASPMFRSDIGDRLKKQLPKLQQHGFAADMAWQ
jgi:phosphoribosylamine--glycine ligase